MAVSEVVTVQEFGDQPILVFADHASNSVPDELNNLGLSDDLLETHIAWDIGAKQLARNLATRLAGTVLTCEFSRLVIDSNRDPAVEDSIPPMSDQIPIPGNQMLSKADRASRIRRYFDPYHEVLEEQVSRVGDMGSPFIVSVHSFTKRMMGAVEDRPWNVGLLWRDDEQSARQLMQWVRQKSTWQVGDNQPYDARYFNYSVDRHVGPKQLRHLTFEVRQDHLGTLNDIQQAGELLAEAIVHVAKSGG